MAPYYKHEVVSDHGVICCAPMETGQSRINAQLIAAAPELLVVAKRAYAVLEAMHGFDSKTTLMRDIEEVVARAQG